MDQKKKQLDSLMNSKEQLNKHYREKYAEMQVQKEIRKPLEIALLEIDVLTQKLERRESMIQLLRHQLCSLPPCENIDPEDARKRAIDVANVEKWRLLTLADEKEALVKEIEGLSKRNTIHEKTIG